MVMRWIFIGSIVEIYFYTGFEDYVGDFAYFKWETDIL